MVIHAVGADADDLGISGEVLIMQGLKTSGLDRASASEIPWIEVNRQPSAP